MVSVLVVGGMQIIIIHYPHHKTLPGMVSLVTTEIGYNIPKKKFMIVGNGIQEMGYPL